MLLSEAVNGERVKLLDIHGGCGIQARLASMGLIPGMEVQVINNIEGGPMILCANEGRIMLGNNVAKKIKVFPLEAAPGIQIPECNMPVSTCRLLRPLRQMQVNETGTIRCVKAKGELGRRIRDMGLVPNTEITVVGRAPLKDPVALRLRDFTLSLRNNEADFITVEVPGV
jgi:ferrous iron transport protein A